MVLQHQDLPHGNVRRLLFAHCQWQHAPLLQSHCARNRQHSVLCGNGRNHRLRLHAAQPSRREDGCGGGICAASVSPRCFTTIPIPSATPSVAKHPAFHLRRRQQSTRRRRSLRLTNVGQRTDVDTVCRHTQRFRERSRLLVPRVSRCLLCTSGARPRGRLLGLRLEIHSDAARGYAPLVFEAGRDGVLPPAH